MLDAKTPSVFEYLDYRAFLKDMTTFLKDEKHLSLRQIGKLMGFKSQSYLSMLLDKSRNLKPQTARSVGHRLGLKTQELSFFETLVRFNQSETAEERDQHYQQLLKFRKFKEIYRTAEVDYEFFNAWYYVILLEALATSWGKKSIREMAQSLRVNESQVRDAIEGLVRRGFLEKTDEGYSRRDPTIETPADIQNIYLRNFHRQMINQAMSALDTVPTPDRYIGGLSISLTRENFEKVKALLFKLQQEVNADYSESADPDAVYQLNIQFFPVLRLKDSTRKA